MKPPKRTPKLPRTPRTRILPLPADDPFYTEPSFNQLPRVPGSPRPKDERTEPIVFDMDEDDR